MNLGKRSKWLSLVVIVSTLAFMLLAQAGLVSAAPWWWGNNSLSAPNISPDGGTFTNSQSVTIDNISGGDTAYYTIDGSEPGDEQHPRRLQRGFHRQPIRNSRGCCL